MIILGALLSPTLFVAVIFSTLCLLLHIDIRNAGWRPIFRQHRIKRALIVALLCWASLILVPGADTWWAA